MDKLWTGKQDIMMLHPGTLAMLPEMLPIKLATPGRLFGQCIYRDEIHVAKPLYENEFVERYAASGGDRSVIFYEGKDGITPFDIEDDIVANWTVRIPHYKMEYRFTFPEDVYRLQRELMLKFPDTSVGGQEFHGKAQKQKRIY